MSKDRLHYVQIRTKTSHYVMPRMDLGPLRILIAEAANPYGNPCLQLINEDASVLSILWDQVVEINVSHVMVTEPGAVYRLETLWARE